jgi:class 3 adenylate cyclase
MRAIVAERTSSRRVDDRAGLGVRTFLIADARGYTRFTQEHGDEAASALASRLAVAARRAASAFGGELLELRGDEAVCVFSSARQAVRAAVELQRRLRAADDGPVFPLGVGVGLDAGEAVPTEGGYRGQALNFAARLCALARPGEVLVSDTVVGLCARVDGVRFLPRRAVRLKGVSHPVRLAEVVPDVPLPPLPTPPPVSAKTPWWRPRGARWRLAVLAALIAIGLAVLGGVISARSREARSPNAPGGVALEQVDLATGRVHPGLPIRDDARGVVAGAGALWIMDPGGLTRLDPATGATRRIAIQGGARNVTFGGGSGFVLGTAADQAGVYQVALSGGSRPQSFSPLTGGFAGRSSAMVAAGGGVWVACYCGVWRLEESDLAQKKLNRVPIGGHFSMAVGAGKVWVVTDSGDLTRIDPVTSHVTPHAVRLPGGRLAREVAFAQGALWVLSETMTEGIVAEVNPLTGDTIHTSRVPGAEFATLTGGQAAVLAYPDTSSGRYVVEAFGPTGAPTRMVRSRMPIRGAVVWRGALWAIMSGAA